MSDTIYNEEFFQKQLRGSLASARIYLGYLFAYWRPSRVIDIGCGRGAWLTACKELAVQRLVGIDGDWVNQNMMLDPEIEFRQANLAEGFDLAESYDLAMSLEVAEHLPPDTSDRFVVQLSKTSDAILFSAALLFQPGDDHINTRLHSFWATRFMAQGYLLFDLFRPEFWSDERIEPWYRQNTFLYIKPSHPLCHALLSRGHRPCKDAAFANCVHPWLYSLVLNDLFNQRSRASANEA
jgi:hypothetical protein